MKNLLSNIHKINKVYYNRFAQKGFKWRQITDNK